MSLRISQVTQAVFSRLPSHQTVLSLSWFNQRLRAIAVHHGEVDGTWTAPEGPLESNRFAEYLQEAVQKTNFRGSRLSVVLSHPRLAQSLQEVPAASGVTLERFLERQVRRQNTFDGEPAWGHQKTLPIRGSAGVLLHLFPRRLLEDLRAAAEKAKLQLSHVLPATAVAQAQLGDLGLAAKDIALVAAETAGSTVVVAGRGDGSLMLARSIAESWTRDPRALALELNRTVLFLTQQYGDSVGRVFLFGEGSAQALETVQGALKVPVQASRIEERPFYWEQEAVRVATAEAPNLITRAEQSAPQRRRMLQVTTVVIGLVVLGAAAGGLVLEALTRRELGSHTQLRRSVESLQNRHLVLQEEHLRLSRDQALATEIGDNRPAPVPAWLLAYLGETLPPPMILASLQAQQEGDAWRIRVSGRMETNADFAARQNALVAWTNLIALGPFQAELLSAGTANIPPGPARWEAAAARLIRDRDPDHGRFTVDLLVR